MNPVVDLVIRVALRDLTFHLELDHCDRLVHLRRKSRVYRIIDIFIQDLRKEPLTRVIPVDLRRKHGQRAEIDSVTVLKNVKSVVADRNPEHITDAGQIACGCAHPGDIVVAPLDIYIVEVHELVHDNVRARSTVEDIADDMQTVHSQVLDQVAERPDELVPHLDVDDGVNDLIVVNFLVVIVVVHMKKFVDDICECRWHFFTHLRSCKLRGYFFTDAHQAVDRDPLPVLCEFSLFLDLADVPFRIVDQIR